MAETSGVVIRCTSPGTIQLVTEGQVVELSDADLSDAAQAIAAGTTAPPDTGVTDLEADRPWLAGLGRASLEDRMALLRNIEKFNLAVVLLHMQDAPDFLAAFRDSMSARAWKIQWEDVTQLASGSIRSSTVRQAVEGIRKVCLDLEAEGRFHRFGLFRSSRFGSPKPVPEDPVPPYPARHGGAQFEPLPQGRCRVSVGGQDIDMALADALRLRAMAARLDVLDQGADAFRRAWIRDALALLAGMSPDAIREWLARLEPRTAAAAAAVSPDGILLAAFTGHMSTMAADAVSRRVARFTQEASPDAALDAAEEALQTAWRLQADERLPFGPNANLLAFPPPTRAAWFGEGT